MPKKTTVALDRFPGTISEIVQEIVVGRAPSLSERPELRPFVYFSHLENLKFRPPPSSPASANQHHPPTSPLPRNRFHAATNESARYNLAVARINLLIVRQGDKPIAGVPSTVVKYVTVISRECTRYRAFSLSAETATRSVRTARSTSFFSSAPFSSSLLFLSTHTCCSFRVSLPLSLFLSPFRASRTAVRDQP